MEFNASTNSSQSTTKAITLEEAIHGLAHHIAKTTDLDAFLILLEYLVKKPNQSSTIARALRVLEQPCSTAKVYQFKAA